MARSLGKGFTLLELMVTLAIIGILAAISVPNFLKLQARSKQSEAKTNLRALFQFEQAFLLEHSVYTTAVARLAFAPERGNRYQYSLSVSQNTDNRTGTTASTSTTADTIMIDTFKYGSAATVGIPATAICSFPSVTPGPVGASFTAVAQGNIDDDATIDVWSVSNLTRDMNNCGSKPGNIAGGEPANELDDVDN